MKNKKTKFFQKYVNNKIKLKPYQKVGVVLLVAVMSGFVGWLWEFLLGEIMGGFRHLYITGGNILPWIGLYAYGGLLIMALTYKLCRYPWLVFVVSALATGLLELFAGWIVFNLKNGVRYWDYNDIWWGFGNINGFVCPVSATVFGLGGLLLMYVLLPFCVRLSLTMTKQEFLTLTISLFVVIVLDDIINLLLEFCGLPTAVDFYYSIGWKFK